MLRGGSSGGVAADGTVTSSSLLLPDGTVGAPGAQWASDNDGTGTGIYRRTTNAFTFAVNGIAVGEFLSTGLQLISTGTFGWSAGGVNGSNSASLSLGGPNSVRFATTNATTTSRTELNKAVAAIANNVATDVLTVTIPNAAHSASLLVRVTGSLGAGGAIGANEATATNSYIIGITRTAGVATVATASAAFGAVAVAVAGAATVTSAATVTAMSGVVSATQTFTVQVTIVRSAGSSDNHTCLVYAQLMNANVTGITLA